MIRVSLRPLRGTRFPGLIHGRFALARKCSIYRKLRSRSVRSQVTKNVTAAVECAKGVTGAKGLRMPILRLCQRLETRFRLCRDLRAAANSFAQVLVAPAGDAAGSERRVHPLKIGRPVPKQKLRHRDD